MSERNVLFIFIEVGGYTDVFAFRGSRGVILVYRNLSVALSLSKRGGALR